MLPYLLKGHFVGRSLYIWPKKLGWHLFGFGGVGLFALQLFFIPKNNRADQGPTRLAIVLAARIKLLARLCFLS